jgi:sialate O-acetylesterase
MTEAMGKTRLATLFSDHMVLQQNRPIPVWGWDVPGQRVTVRLVAPGSQQELGSGSAHADASGRFGITLPPLADGGGYELVVEGSSSLRVRDVWIGEVWLASGQSNMEWRVAASLNADTEIAQAAFPRIRMFKVTPCAALDARTDVSGAWAVCSPDTAADFSAVGYFFARAIHEARAVAIGIIDSTWGGTCIEAWTSLDALAPVLPELPKQLAELRRELQDLPALERKYQAQLLDWQRSHLPVDDQNRGLALGWANPSQDDASWPEMAMPSFWQSHGHAFNGIVWFRTRVELPESFVGRELVLSLGALDDFDDSYFDGEAVGKTPPGTLDAHQLRRRYRVPAALARRGSHCIAVRVFDHFGNGGFAGPRSELFLARADGEGERLPLDGPWKYRVEREIPLVPLDVFQSAPPAPWALAQQHAPAALFHGMIAPLVPYAIRGAIWYQGESNTARAASYRALMIALLRDWRTRFGQGQFPFYYVQLANFRGSATWPVLREAQAEALTEPETGMVVTLDVGDRDDIHPKNKQEVGRRLALLARARTYGERDLAAEGPRLARIELSGREVRVRFSNAHGLRSSDGGPVRGFALASSDGQFHAATAQLAGEELWLESGAVREPRAVRYAWADDPDANLENAAGLPAAPFRTDPGF